MKISASTKSFWIAMLTMGSMVVLMMLCSPTCYVAASALLMAGDRLFNWENMPTAVRLLRFPAEHGVLMAQEQLGNHYFAGSGVPRNIEEAKKWLLMAAQRGDGGSQGQLARLYAQESGDDPKNLVEATKWYEKAAAQGRASSQYSLFKIYFGGCAVKQDLARAYAWCKRAAEHGEAMAEEELANLYRRGCGTKQDLVSASKWYKAASDQGIPSSQVEYSIFLNSGIGCEKNPAAAVKLLKNAAEHGDMKARELLGYVYYFQLLGQKDDNTASKILGEAAKLGSSGATYLTSVLPKQGTTNGAKRLALLEQAANSGEPHAQNILGALFASGFGKNYDEKTAFDWLQKAAAKGDCDAQKSVGVTYCYGAPYAPLNTAASVQWLTKAAEGGNSDAQVWLGSLYSSGQGVPLNAAKSFEWMLRAAEHGNTVGQMCTSWRYEGGIGVPRDVALSEKWLRRAVTSGYAPAQDELADFVLRTSRVNKIDESIELRKAAVDQGFGPAMFVLSECHQLGIGVDYDPKKALEIQEKLADRGDIESIVSLGDNYRVSKAELSTKYFRRAANDGDVASAIKLGDMYRSGELGDPDFNKACKWYSKAAAAGSDEGSRKLKQYAGKMNKLNS